MQHKFENIRKILFIKLRHLGDVVLTIPVFRILKQNFPDAYVAPLVNSGTEEILIGNPFIDEIIVFDRAIIHMNPLKRLFKELSFYRTIKMKNFDMTINLTGGDRGAFVSLLSGARYRLAYKPQKGLIGKKYFYTHIAEKNGNHALLQNIALLDKFGIYSKGTIDTNIYIPEEADLFVKKIFKENKISKEDIVIHIHPTSRWLFKCWKDEYMAEIIKWLIDKKIYVVITSSPDEKEITKIKKILSLIPESYNSKIINLCGKINIKQLAAISKASDIFFGVDTAPMHIAAFVGTTVIALFGAGQDSWKPWGEKHLVISKNVADRKKLSREDFIQQNINAITPQEVIEKFEKVLKGINK